MPRLSRRLARLEARDPAEAVQAAACLEWLAPIAAGTCEATDAFSPVPARVLLTGLAVPRTRGRALAFLDALAAFGRNGADRDPAGA